MAPTATSPATTSIARRLTSTSSPSLGVGCYRFSISWPRVQPLGHGAWNEAGFAFYERLVEGLRARGLKAFLTLNHWDLPQAPARPWRLGRA